MEHFEVLSNGMRILQCDDLFRLGTDSILLADFCTPLRGRRIADLGCGGGALGVLLCAGNPMCSITGIELQESACAIAQQNIAINSLESRFSIVPGDLRQIQSLLPANSFDAVVSNPPYFPVGSGASAAEEAIAIARTERCCTLENLCQAVCWLLRYGGSFYVVHRPERLAELMDILRAHRLEPKRLRLVRHRANAPVSHILVESRYGGKPGLQIEPELLLFSDSGEPTMEYRKIYHM